MVLEEEAKPVAIETEGTGRPSPMNKGISPPAGGTWSAGKMQHIAARPWEPLRHFRLVDRVRRLSRALQPRIQGLVT